MQYPEKSLHFSPHTIFEVRNDTQKAKGAVYSLNVGIHSKVAVINFNKTGEGTVD